MHDENKRPVLLAWIQSHVQSVPCNFSSVDVHTQHTFSKIHEGVLGLVVEIKDDGQLGQYDFYEMSQQGAKLVESCSRKKNCNTREQHQSCNNPCIYKSALEKIILHDDTLLEVKKIMVGSLEYHNEPSETKKKFQRSEKTKNLNSNDARNCSDSLQKEQDEIQCMYDVWALMFLLDDAPYLRKTDLKNCHFPDLMWIFKLSFIFALFSRPI